MAAIVLDTSQLNRIYTLHWRDISPGSFHSAIPRLIILSMDTTLIDWARVCHASVISDNCSKSGPITAEQEIARWRSHVANFRLLCEKLIKQ